MRGANEAVKNGAASIAFLCTSVVTETVPSLIGGMITDSPEDTVSVHRPTAVRLGLQNCQDLHDGMCVSPCRFPVRPTFRK